MADTKKNKYYVDEAAETRITEMMYKHAMKNKQAEKKPAKTGSKKK